LLGVRGASRIRRTFVWQVRAAIPSRHALRINRELFPKHFWLLSYSQTNQNVP
jgi:hypothetical protein